MLCKNNSFIKRFVSIALISALLFSFSCFKGTKISAAEKSDYSVEIETPDSVSVGKQLTLTVKVTDIKYPEFSAGKGIFGVGIFLYYNSNVFTPAKDGFSCSVPSKWDGFDGTATAGVWGLYSVFDGNLKNGAVADGDISFTLTFDVSTSVNDTEALFYIDNCECTGYSSESIVLIDSFEASAYCKESIKIDIPPLFISKDNSPLTIDEKNGIIYSNTPNVNYPTFVSFFSEIASTLSIKAYDYEITEENGYFIPAGATITFKHTFSPKVQKFTYYLLGDCNRNGTITKEDLEVIKQTIVNRVNPEGHDKYAMDLDKDGSIHASDYYTLKFKILK